MTTGQEEGDRLSWLEALHEAVVADEDDAFLRGDSQVPPADNADALRDCLRKLEAARRAGDWNQKAPLADSWPGASAPKQIGKFRILRTLGGGGQGIVFLAFDTDLRRQVALKVPKPESLVSPDARRRFLREAHAAAGLTHPGIVAVHEIAEAFPACYLVSDYCPGGSLQQYLQDRPEPVAPQAAAQLVAEIAAGVHYAHAHGVLHRDIKPSNVFLVERHDHSPAATDAVLRFVPKLGDFGLARLAENDEQRTATGAILGTPAYMSPEQAGGRTAEICTATDVYGLGTILYELLTGRPTFRGVTDADTLRQVLFVEPAPLRQVNPRVPRDLEAVCLRALEKDPTRRYSSAAALADDLHRYLEGRPTLVRPLTPIGKLWRVARRRPAVALLASLLSLALLIALALFVSSDIEQRRLNAQLIEQRQAAEKQAQENSDLAYAADMQLADLAWGKNDISGLEVILSRHQPEAVEYDPRGLEWHYLRSRLDDSRILLSGTGPGGCVQFSSDGKRLAAGGHDGTVHLWVIPDGKLKWTISEPQRAEINAVSFSPDGKTLAAASNAGRVLLCDSATGRINRILSGGHSAWVADIDFSPDGNQLCSVAGDGTIALWDLQSAQLSKAFRGHTQALRSVRFTRDGQHAITGGQEGIIDIWDLQSQTSVASIVESQPKPSGNAVWPRDIALNADRTRMAVCWDIGGLRLYDVSDVARPILLESILQEKGNQVHFLANDRFAVGSTYGTGHIWKLGKPQPERELKGLRDKIVGISGTPDGCTIATASKDGTVRLWPAEAQRMERELAVLQGRCNKLVLSPAGDEIMLELSGPKRINLLKINTGEVRQAGPTEARAAAYLTTGRGLAIATDSSVSIYRRVDGELAFSWSWTRSEPSPPGDALGELWSTERFVFIRANHEIWALDLERQALAWRHVFDEGVWDIAASPDETLIYVGDQVGRIHAFRITDGTSLPSWKGPACPVKALSISSDGRFLLSGFENREIWIWDRAQEIVVQRLASQEEHVSAARFSKSGRTVLGHYGSYLDFWHVPSGQRVVTTGPWSNRQVKWDLSADERTIYLAISSNESASVRALSLQGKHSLSAVQTSRAHPD